MLRCKYWDPEEVTFRNKDKIPSPNLLQDMRPLAPALSTDVLVDPDPRDKIFCYIDDLVTIGLIDVSWNHLAYTVPLAIGVFGRPNHDYEQMHRDELTSMKKLSAKGSLGEKKIILGWQFDFRELIISLPKDKFKEWSKHLSTLIKERKGCIKDLDSAIGRNGHAAQIIPLNKHFNNRLR